MPARIITEFTGLDPMEIHADYSQCSVIWHLFIHGGATCPVCSGSGRYIGLYVVANFERCGGNGIVDDQPAPLPGRPLTKIHTTKSRKPTTPYRPDSDCSAVHHSGVKRQPRS